MTIKACHCQPSFYIVVILFWFYFSGCIKQDYKNKYFVTGDWSQSRNIRKPQ